MPNASYVARLIALSTLLAAAPNVLAQGTQTGQASTVSGGSTEELEKAAQNPVSSLISVQCKTTAALASALSIAHKMC
jgi:hypothetical protein